jgi:hypothetical protein
MHGTHRCAAGRSAVPPFHHIITVVVGGEKQHVGLLVTVAAHLEDASRSSQDRRLAGAARLDFFFFT